MSLIFYSWCCLSFFDLHILITTFLSSNSSYIKIIKCSLNYNGNHIHPCIFKLNTESCPLSNFIIFIYLEIFRPTTVDEFVRLLHVVLLLEVNWHITNKPYDMLGHFPTIKLHYKALMINFEKSLQYPNFSC